MIVIGLSLVLSCKTSDDLSETRAAMEATTWPFPLEHGETFYSDDQGNENFWVDQLKKQTLNPVRQTKEANGMARRAVHSKAHGCVVGQFIVNPDRPHASRFGIFKHTGPTDGYPVWIRFSNATPKIQSDLVPDGRGMAIKIIVGRDEEKLLPGEEDSNSIDFAFVNGPTFFARNLREYHDFLESPVKFLATHPRAAKIAKDAAVSGSQIKMKSPLEGTYWSMGAYKLGPQAVKFKTRPCAKTKFGFALPKLGSNYLRDAMIKQLTTDRKEACFEFGVQFQTNPPSMPVEDPTVEWRESSTLMSSAKRLVTGHDPVSKFVKVATIKIPAQIFAETKQDKFCERLSFNPWRTIPAHRPLGNLMRARLQLYKASLAERLELNKMKPVQNNLSGSRADVTL
jgi:hypothetical protein